MAKRMRAPMILAFLATLGAGCAQVPQQSVELSATVGRDLATIHAAHRELAQVLFARMRQDVNRFTDEVFAPHQIAIVIERQAALARSPEASERRKSLFLAISSVTSAEASPADQAAVIRGMSILVDRLTKDIEKFRRELQAPLELQESAVVASIDRAYQQVHYANSIVSGHLASVAKVHDKQTELLAAIGVERDLRKDIGENLAKTSGDISELVRVAEKGETRLDSVEAQARKLKDTVRALTEKLGVSPEEK